MKTAYLLLTKDSTIPGTNPEPFGVAVNEKDEAKRFCQSFKERGETSLPMYDVVTLGTNNIWESRSGCWNIPDSDLTVFDTLDAALAKGG